jgi:hypothetical protein
MIGPDRRVDPDQEDDDARSEGDAAADARDELDWARSGFSALARLERLVVALFVVIVPPARSPWGVVVLVVRPATADVLVWGSAGLGHGGYLGRRQMGAVIILPALEGREQGACLGMW